MSAACAPNASNTIAIAAPSVFIALRTAAASEIFAQSPDAFEQTFLAGCKAPAREALAFGAEGAAGCEPQPRLAHQPLAEVEAVHDPFDTEEDVHRPRRRRDFYALDSAELRDQKITCGAEASERVQYRWLALGHSNDARALHEHGRAGGVVFDELAEVGHQRRWSDDPAQPPPGHQPRFGKTVGAYDTVGGIGKIEEGRRAIGCAVVKPLVDIVGDDPDAVLAAMRENRVLRLTLESPAGGVVRRI